MRNPLSHPYRLANTGLAAWRNALAFGLFVLLFLVVFEPFGLAAFKGAVWKTAFGYGAICTAVMFVLNGLVPRLMPSFFSGSRWTVGREIGWTLVNVLLIGLANLVYSVVIGLSRPSWSTLLWFEAYTLLIGLFPVTAVVLWNEARLSRRYREGSEQVNARMPPIADRKEVSSGEASMPTGKAAVITIPSESGREDLTLPASELLFIRSAGNYLEVHKAQGAHVERHVLRGSLKRTEEALSGNPRLLRCHKSHLVNLDRVSRVSGNAQGFQLHLDQGMEVVPVSRRLNDRIGGLLAARP
jgi:hypothetical protein